MAIRFLIKNMIAQVKQINEENNQEGLDSSSNYIVKGFVENDAIVCMTNLECHNSFSNLAKHIVDTYKPKRVLELGSGAGDISYFVRELDPNVIYVSVDINKKAAKSPWYMGNNSYHFISYTNRPLHFVDDKDETIIFDLILSFGHLEHITEDTFDVLLNNIKRHMDKNTIVLCTIGIIDADRNVHPNIKTKQEWYDYIFSKGFQVTYPSNFPIKTERPFNMRIASDMDVVLDVEISFKLL